MACSKAGTITAKDGNYESTDAIDYDTFQHGTTISLHPVPHTPLPNAMCRHATGCRRVFVTSQSVMSERDDIFADWNPWHGCTKISPGCKYCYVYRQDEMYGSEIASSICRKTAAFDLPVKLKRDRTYKIPSGKVLFTCFSSDFLLKDADQWRPDCWRMMRHRQDLYFYFFTKRIDRLAECLPPDWGKGYPNVMIGCTVENQEMADYRLPIFKALPILHKSIILSPLIGPVDISPYLDFTIEEVSVGGESGANVRPCNYDWVLYLQKQCVEKDIPFRFHQTGALLVKDGKEYHIPRKLQHSQAHKAGIDYGLGRKEFQLISEPKLW